MNEQPMSSFGKFRLQDPSTEAAVTSALFNLANGGRTSIFVAHRLMTARMCDRIAVISGGELVEEGSHDQLLAQNGHYATLWGEQQSFNETPSAAAAA
jgi:ABC-type multidrug transport system fused ATPase/permease subunit